MHSTVVVVKEKDPAAGVQKCLNHLEEQGINFQNLGQVLIKPNLALPVPPEARPEITSPAAVGSLVRELLKRGTKKVLVGDEPAWGVSSRDVFRSTGLGDIVTGSGGCLCAFEAEPRQTVTVPNGHVVRKLSLPRAVVESDFIINFPKMKTSIMTDVTLGIKNLLGCITFEDRKRFHREVDLAYLLVDIYKAVKPGLTIVDGIVAMEGYGAHLGDPVDKELLIAGVDVVAVDSVCCVVMGIDPKVPATTQVAVKQGIGKANLQEIVCVGEDIYQQVSVFSRPIFLLANPNDNVFVFPGGICPGCKPRIKVAPPNPDPAKRHGVIIGREPIAMAPGIEMDEWWLVGNCGIRAGQVYLAREKYLRLKSGSPAPPFRINKIPGCPPLEWYADNAVFKNLRKQGWMRDEACPEGNKA